MNLENIKKVYISGIGGIGVSALARFFVSKNIEVVGSDLEQSEVTDRLEKVGVKINFEQTAENLNDSFDLFIYSAAVPKTNHERAKALDLKIPNKSYPEMLGEISRNYKTVGISGTNGKSTTTAMIASILLDAKKDPTVIVGSCLDKLDDNFHAGKSDLFIVEACEYRAHMLLLEPRAIVLTNIEEDHLDFYKDLNHIVQTFQQYVNKLRNADDLLVYNNDDLNIRKLQMPDCKKVSFGFVDGADVLAQNLRKETGKQIFNLVFEDRDLGEFELHVPGDFNVYNALAAITYALMQDVPLVVIKESLKDYKGIWRRFELVRNDDITVISDYAHHPTAVQGTINAAREFFPSRRLIAVFQPHQHARTKKMFNEFIGSFENVDNIVISEIYDVAGREEQDADVSSQDLISALKKQTPNKEIVYTRDLDETLRKVNSIVKQGDVILVMGAGDIYKICKSISTNLQK